MKTILLATGIFPPDIGGPASYVPKVAKRMLKDGIKPIVITYSNNKSENDYDNQGFEVVRIVRSRIFVWNYIKFFFALLKLIPKVDLIYLQDYFSAGIPTYFANLFFRKKLFVKVVGIFSWEQSMLSVDGLDLLDDYIQNKQSFGRQLWKRFELFLLKGFGSIIVPSNYMKNLLIKFGIKSENIDVVYNSYDQIDFNKIDVVSMRSDLGIDPGKKVYLSVGRLVTWKNFDKLIKSFKDIDGVLFIAGDGPLRNDLQSLIDTLGLADKIKLVGQLNKDQLYSYYQLADVFVLISSYEGMSHVLIEAIDMNLSIISSNIAPNIETLEGYDNFKIVDICDELVDLNIKSSLGNSDNKDFFQKFNFENLYVKLMGILGK